jgi:hypothetical protein
MERRMGDRVMVDDRDCGRFIRSNEMMNEKSL